ncbi:uncharacterized protein LOC110456034 [Mizuhopecten yessoensis]|uniref:Threonylcarbamoyl-AMP synthase n=1 Tax=Mizuhopecten yessoensis TaxID=6573 RepID=A0A210QBT8_MIZYE|nr:uncharacterized protein LOC110456034 [Mizuhopecten yessoensis]OWF46191.1 tRNA threonylcarbamoyladenosine biosynthesis protein YwlC [Mizuhopecten yessoensis]
MVTVNEMEGSRTSGRGLPFASVLYSEPGALGLMANIMAALIVAIGNMVEGEHTKLTLIIAGVHLILVGGFLQLVAGLLSFRRNDHLTGTAFVVFASLWSFQGITYILTTDMPDLNGAALSGLVGYMAVAMVLFVCSLFVNYILPPVLAAMLLTLVFEAAGLYFLWAKRVAAAFELFIVFTAIYAVVVMTTKGVSLRYVLPGFGNAPIDPLLIRTFAKGKKKNETKKNTKYAEPMGLGYIANIVPAAVLCFHSLGYFTDFRPAMGAFMCSSLCHIVSSYYAFLRRDHFHSVQFIVYFIFWISRGVGAFLVTFDLGGDTTSVTNYYGSWGMVLVLVAILVVSTTQSVVVFLYNLLLTLIAILSVEHIPGSVRNYTFGVSSAILALVSIYISIAHLLNSLAEKSIVYVGPEIIAAEKLQCAFGCFRKKTDETEGSPTDLTEGSPPITGDSDKDLNVVDSLAFLGNMVAAIALSPAEVTHGQNALPWLLVSGVLINLYCARLAYAAGSLARAFMMVVLAMVWGTWSLVFFEGIDASQLKGAAIGVMCLHTCALLMTTTFSRVWMVFGVSVELNILALVFQVFAVNSQYMGLVTSLFVGIIGLYGTLSGILKGVIDSDALPKGEPVIKPKAETEEERLPCEMIPSRKASALWRAAQLLDEGHVIGVPTDTVYALASSCKVPKSVSAIYHIKGRPAEKPICLCISNIEQLKAANPPFSALLWRFMDVCYPGGITCVVPKGEWLARLGVGDAVDYIGTKESVAIRVPDSSVLSYLTSISGPVALTSANPSGEPDSLHHDTVIDTLGHKLAAVVCDDESNEIVASTVVNCAKIDEGVISYFRIGCVPKERVDQLFEQVKSELNRESTKVNMNQPSFNS